MKQLTQKLKSGSMRILGTPLPALHKGQVLVRNHYSLVSPGTESSTVITARKSLIGKAKERPQQVKQVIDTLRSQGPVQTYRAVMKKLDAYSPLGYSCAGQIIDLDPDIRGFKVGDFVACGGFTASHAEIVCVPVNLCVRLEPKTDMRQATYNTLGAIAMQGVRQADLRLGETCAIIGLGLLGQLTGLLLKAAGVRVIGVDIDARMVEIASKHCADLALCRDDVGLEGQIQLFTEGLGCDAVIITAASSSLDPINFAGSIAGKRSTVVVVGAVPTGFDREPHFYKKELQLRMSCSYGPGRYDPGYEEKGIDYPPAYVRWTENRNMKAFQDLIYSKRIDVGYLTTHIFKLANAPAAYEMILARSEPFIGIRIEYDVPKDGQGDRNKILIKSQSSSAERLAVSIGFIGAGSYAQSHLLPNIPKGNNVALKGVATATGPGSRSSAERFGFEFCTTDEREILDNSDINTVFIATRHNTHADFVLKCLKAGKHVFVEKPLCLTLEELHEISEAYLSLENSRPMLMLGYNRRFSPLARMMKTKLGNGPLAMLYRINAGQIPGDSWIQDPDIGGGRIIGEICHFVDFLTFMNGSLPISVYAMGMRSPDNMDDILNISLSYENGSIGTIAYYANGDKSLAKERCEIFGHGVTAVLEDFKNLTLYAGGKKRRKNLLSQNKGQKNEVFEFVKAIIEGGDSVIPFKEIINTSMVTFKIIESLRSGQHLKIQPGYFHIP